MKLEQGSAADTLMNQMVAIENKIRELKAKKREQGKIYGASKVAYIRDKSVENKARREEERNKYAEINDLIDEEKVSLSIARELLKAERPY